MIAGVQAVHSCYMLCYSGKLNKISPSRMLGLISTNEEVDFPTLGIVAHRWEKNDVTNIRRPCEEHHKSIYTNTFATTIR